jgi:electron transfer flavoprotein beta subunit
MKILVCITHVPDTTSKISFVDGNKKFNQDGVQYIIGPYDDYALARAVELKEGGQATEIVALHVGTVASEATIRKALSIGADRAIRVDAEPTDSLFVAQEIAAIAKKDSYDLILMGRESIDFNGGVVHGMVAEILGLPCVTPVMKLDINGSKAIMTKEIEGGKESIEVNLPVVIGCQEPIAEWKIPSMRGIMAGRTKPLEVVSPSNSQSATSIEAFELPPAKGAVKLISPDNVEELVRLLKSEAKVL